MTDPTPPQGIPAPATMPQEPAPFSILPPDLPAAPTAPIPLSAFGGSPQHAAPRNRALGLAFTGVVLSLLAITVSVFAWAVDHPVNPQGPPGPQGAQGPAGPRGHNHVTLCIIHDPANGDVADITVPVHGQCGPSSVMIQVP